MTLKLGIGRSFVRSVGTGVAHGPTVQIASVPATLTLAHGATGSALAGTPQDISAVSTGQRKYWHSSDATIVTVDADTGVPTGVAAGSATITVNFVAPAASGLAEPIVASIPGVDMIFSVGNDLGVAPTDTIDSMFATNASIGPLRFRPISNTGTIDHNYVKLVTRPDGTGVGLWMRGDFAAYGNFIIAPTADNITNPGGGPVFNRNASHFFQHRVKFDTDVNPPTTPVRIKNIYGLHQDTFGRIEWSSVDWNRPGSPHLTHFSSIDGPTYPWDDSLRADPAHPVYSDLAPFGGATQVLGPWLNEDIANSGTLWRFTYQYKPNTISPGTVDIHLESGHFYVFEDLIAAGVTNGQRIKIASSAAEFVVTEIRSAADWAGGEALTHCYLVRQPDITGVTATYTIDPNSQIQNGDSTSLGDIKQSAHFSLSQAGVLTSGNNGGYVTMREWIHCHWRVTDFDGDKFCNLVKESSDFSDPGSNITGDHLGATFNNTQDGISRMWIAPDSAPAGTGTLVMDISQTGIGVTPPGGESHYCTKAVIAGLAIADGIGSWQFYGTPTQGQPNTYILYGPVQWGVTGGRGSYP